MSETVAPLPILVPPLTGRLAPPRRRVEPVPRPRLIERLTSIAHAPVLVIRAPAGYGKSTLLSQFAAQERRPVAWLSLDERDDDPVVLLNDLAHAVGAAGTVDDELLRRLAAGPGGVVPLALPRLIAVLGERTEPLVIVLDDVHVLRSAGAVDVVRTLCDHAPDGCTIVLGSRSRPQLPIARLRAGGRLSELGAADLRMTPGEGAAMLRAAGVEATDREVAAVVRRTEGWPAAIYLAGLLLRRGGERADDEAMAPGDADLAEYFREEVLAEADPDDTDFLIRVSVLDELRPEICAAVLERDDADARLRALADADLFVTPSHGFGAAYRIHSLFRDMLQAELRTTHRELEADLHRRACEAYREAGDGERAIHHALAAGEVEIAADLVWLLAPMHIPHGRAGTVVRWCGWFSEEQLVAHPQAALGRGWAAYEAGDAQDAAHCAALAIGAEPGRVLPDGCELRAMGLMLRAALSAQGERQALADATAADAGMPRDNPLRAVPMMIIGMLTRLEDDRTRAREALAEAELLAAGRITTAYGLVLSHQALLAIEEDRWDEAEALVGRAAAQQRAAGVDGYASQGIVPAVRALTLARRGRTEQAREAADQAARSLALLGFTAPWLELETRLVLACAYARVGDGGRARTLVSEGRRIEGAGHGPLVSRWLARVEAEIERCGIDPAAGPGLTTAELRTLQFLPTHLSLREIGERLYITRNTVKTHTVSVYRKLGVGSRSEAVARGRELGLLDG